ncbi:hypothetical protein VitviT2T_019689 [Vitis vinifera]|uniref:Uncharacterized protein n=1 Tax=Vitis vinifera TaxID=29760 RepID=A0ABY9D220_VITVI|nr:hypothetical protein VitviT2T_019689 [Vitis vinifera]
MAPKRAPTEPTSTGNKGKRTERAKKPETKRKRSDPQRSTSSKQKTSKGAPCTGNKGKRPVVEKSIEGARANADHSSQIGRNDAEASNKFNAQINSLGTHLEEMALNNDWRLTSLENRIDGFQEQFKAGERWLLGQMNLPDAKDSIPADMCLLLVLESSRVEVVFLLNELAYLKYETSSNSSSNVEIISLKQWNLAIAFSLVEKTIKLISNVVENEVNPIDENTLSKVISGLNETVGVVLEIMDKRNEMIFLLQCGLLGEKRDNKSVLEDANVNVKRGCDNTLSTGCEDSPIGTITKNIDDNVGDAHDDEDDYMGKRLELLCKFVQWI